MNQAAAEALSLEALAFLAGDERRLAALLVQAGWALADLRERLGDPVVLAGILDFLLADENMVIAFCESTGRPPQDPLRARRLLPGGGDF